MKRTVPSLAIVMTFAALSIIGAGCAKKASTPSAPASSSIVSPTISDRSTVQTPKDSWQEYASAAPRTEKMHDVTFDRSEGKVTISVPEDWKGEGVVWRPDDGKLNHVRIAHFTDDGPQSAWEGQKALGVHEVVHAEQAGDRYLLMVNHPGLQASILKVFIPDPKLPGTAYYFFECRAAYGADRAAIWSACKGAYESLRIE
jgi:hypothetical protein